MVFMVKDLGRYTPALAFSAAAQLGLGPFVTAEIIAAADNADDHFPEVRALLLEACGITE